MAKILRTPGIIQQQKEVEREADKDSDRAVVAILRVLRSFREQLSETDIEREVLRKQVEVVSDELDLVLTATLARGLRTGRRVTAGHVPAALREDAAQAVSRAGVTPRAAQWADREAAKLVRQVTRGVQRTVRQEVAAGLRAGLRPEALAQEIRQVVGLDRRRAATVRNFRRAQEAAGVSAGVIEQRATRMTNRLLRDRAETIARTETFRAVNEGRNDLWAELVDENVVEQEEVVRIWITARDERVDNGNPDGVCARVDGDQVGLREDFDNGFHSPPAHPGCRCTLQYRQAA